MYKFRDWMGFGVLQIWSLYLNKVPPVHDLPDIQPTRYIAQILPAIHALNW